MARLLKIEGSRHLPRRIIVARDKDGGRCVNELLRSREFDW